MVRFVGCSEIREGDGGGGGGTKLPVPAPRAKG
jgi:hypothetical protein